MVCSLLLLCVVCGSVFVFVVVVCGLLFVAFCLSLFVVCLLFVGCVSFGVAR